VQIRGFFFFIVPGADQNPELYGFSFLARRT